MEKNDTILVYLTKFVQCRDEIGSVGVTIADDDLASLALLGLPKSWHSYEDSDNGWEKTTRLGGTLVGSSVGGDKAEHQRWLFIKT